MTETARLPLLGLSGLLEQRGFTGVEILDLALPVLDVLQFSALNRLRASNLQIAGAVTGNNSTVLNGWNQVPAGEAWLVIRASAYASWEALCTGAAVALSATDAVAGSPQRTYLAQSGLLNTAAGVGPIVSAPWQGPPILLGPGSYLQAHASVVVAGTVGLNLSFTYARLTFP